MGRSARKDEDEGWRMQLERVCCRYTRRWFRHYSALRLEGGRRRGRGRKKNEKEKKTEDDTPCRGGLVCAGKVVRNMDARWEAEPRNVAPEPADHKSGGFGPKEGFGNIIMPS